MPDMARAYRRRREMRKQNRHQREHERRSMSRFADIGYQAISPGNKRSLLAASFTIAGRLLEVWHIMIFVKHQPDDRDIRAPIYVSGVMLADATSSAKLRYLCRAQPRDLCRAL